MMSSSIDVAEDADYDDATDLTEQSQESFVDQGDEWEDVEDPTEDNDTAMGGVPLIAPDQQDERARFEADYRRVMRENPQLQTIQPGEKWTLIQVCHRSSGLRPLVFRAGMRRRQQRIGRRYRRRLIGRNPQIPELDRPGGAGTRMEITTLYMARQGTLAVPTSTIMLRGRHQRALRRFVRLMRFLYHPLCPIKPMEVHFLLGGIAGLSVNDHAWGSWLLGFWSAIRRADAQLAERTYLVPLIEAAIVGVLPWQLAPVNWPTGYLNKRWRKIHLGNLIRRALALRTAQFGNLPILPHPLDWFIFAMDDEWSFRSHQLNNTTNPRLWWLRLRNRNRNGEWQ